MEKVRNFIKEHNKEILICAGIIFVYRLGFKSGFSSSELAMKNLIRETSKALDIKRF